MAAKKPSAVDNTLTLDFWAARWTEQKSGWHEADGNQLMWEHLPDVLKEKRMAKKPEEVRVFVPLCGKAVDMYKLYQLGFTVVGVEFARQAIDEFFAENQLQEKPDTAPPFRSTQDGRLIVGEGDLFTFGGDGSQLNQLPFDKYDIVWDRGSLEAINVEDREKYAALILSLMADDAVILMNTKVYDRTKHGGPPAAMDTADLEAVYGASLSVTFVAEASEPKLTQGLGTDVTEQLHVLRR